MRLSSQLITTTTLVLAGGCQQPRVQTASVLQATTGSVSTSLWTVPKVFGDGIGRTCWYVADTSLAPGAVTQAPRSLAPKFLTSAQISQAASSYVSSAASSGQQTGGLAATLPALLKALEGLFQGKTLPLGSLGSLPASLGSLVQPAASSVAQAPNPQALGTALNQAVDGSTQQITIPPGTLVQIKAILTQAGQTPLSHVPNFDLTCPNPGEVPAPQTLQPANVPSSVQTPGPAAVVAPGNPPQVGSPPPAGSGPPLPQGATAGLIASPP